MYSPLRPFIETAKMGHSEILRLFLKDGAVPTILDLIGNPQPIIKHIYSFHKCEEVS